MMVNGEDSGGGGGGISNKIYMTMHRSSLFILQLRSNLYGMYKFQTYTTNVL